MKDPDGQPIIAIIYHNNRPFSVFSGDNRYSHEHDFEWCEADGISIHHESGMGPGGPYLSPYCAKGSNTGVKIWVRPGVQLQDNTLEARRIPTCRRRLARMGYRLLRSPILLESAWCDSHNPFEWGLAQHGTAEYCSVCESWRKSDTDHPCEHLWWCEDCSTFAGPGTSDGCECVQNTEQGGSSASVTGSGN